MLFLPSRLAQRLSCAAVQRCSGSPLRAASARYGRFAASWWFRECVCRGSETCLDHAKLEICRRRLLVSCKTLELFCRRLLVRRRSLYLLIRRSFMTPITPDRRRELRA